MKSLFVIGSFFLATFCFGQEITGSIVGTVQDASGAGVPAAKVIVTNTDRNAVIRSTVTGSQGEYSAPLLPIGHYAVAVEAKGFKRSVKRDINLNVDDKLTVNIALEVGDVQQEVTVEEGISQVELQSSTAQALISGSQVRSLALNSRNYEQLVTLMPGVTFTGSSTQIYIGATNPFSGASNQVPFAINGARTSANAWLVDGADNVDRGANLTLLNYPSVDAIAEFNVLRGQYSAEFGRNAGGMINVITRSGSNQFHGDAYEFFRNNDLAANTFFNNANKVNLGPDGTAQVPPLRYNNFGYTIGGPVWIPKVYNGKNKTFFFFSEEFRRVINYATVQGFAPTADQKKGIFSSPVCVAATSSGVCTSTASQIANIDPTAAAYIKDIFSKIPDGRLTDNTINVALRNVYNARQELYRIDHVFSPKWSVAGRYLNDTIPTEEPRGLFQAGTIPGVFNTSTNSPGHNFIVRVVGTISPTLVNEAGYSYSYGAILSTPTGLDASVNSPDVNLKLPFPVTLGRIPTLLFSGTALSSVGGFGPYNDYNRNQNWFDNLTKIYGKHTIKVGITYDRYNKHENQASNNVGTFTFATTPRPTGTTTAAQAWANFLLGTVSSFTQANDLTPNIFLNQTEMYVQDDYRVRKNLTINMGVRYSLFRQPTDGGGALNNFDPASYDPAKAPKIDALGNLVPGTGDPLNGSIYNNKNSPFGGKITNDNNHDFAPRFGFSWDPFGTGKTAIRGGYGYAYDSVQISNVYESPITNNPASNQTIAINNTTFANVVGGTAVNSVAPPALSAVAIPFHTPYVQQWSLDVQRELPLKVIFDVGYYASHGTHLIGQVDINEPGVGAGVAAGLTDANTPFTRTTDPKLNAIRPYLGYNAINTFETVFNSNYHSLQIAAKKEIKTGGFIGLAYTWSKLLTDAGTDVAAPMNSHNFAGDYGLSPYDRTQVLTINWDYELPWFKSRHDIAGWTLGGWEVSGILSASGGLPLNASDSTLGTDPGGLGILGSSAAGPRADQICDPNKGAPHTIAQWFNTNCFTDVPKGQVRPGNAGRNTIRGPGYQNWDISMFKNFHFGETRSLQFRGEFFNIFNHTNPATIATTLGGTTFGQVTAARDPRLIQLGLKLYF